MKRTAIAALIVAIAPLSYAAELPFTGFLEVGLASRVVSDDNADDEILMQEGRFQLDFLNDGDYGTLQFKGDFVSDGVTDESRLELRELSIVMTPHEQIDLKVGRQTLTWGTGDLLFLNDLFPKDWQSFFIGRDDEYLKKPSDALRASWFGDTWNIDLAWTPIFTPDGFVDGERLSYWGGAGKAGPQSGYTIDPVEVDKTIDNGELAGRIYANLGGNEIAFYGYRGFYGQPLGYDMDEGNLYHPELVSYGASIRSAIFGGVGNIEVARYQSEEDESGDKPMVPNSEVRGLVAFSREILPEQTLGVQFYIEHMEDWDTPAEDAGGFDLGEDRVWWTLRYRGMFLQQNLILSLFTFYSPTDDDGYARPKVTYKISDKLQYTIGGNVFFGEEENSFFGQLEDNTNIYARLRYSY